MRRNRSLMSEMGHSRRFLPFGDMSVIRRIADENQISSDVADIPIVDIGAWASVSAWLQPRAIKQRVQPGCRFHYEAL